MLNGTNFLKWKEALMFQLGLMDLDLWFRVSAPRSLIDKNNTDVKILHERWERSNILSLSFMLQHVPRDIRDLVTSNNLVTIYTEMIEQQFVGSDKIKAGALIQKFTFMCYIRKGNIQEYIMVMCDIVGKLNDMKIIILEAFLVHYILQTLSIQYDLFKVSYNTHKNEWSVNDLMTKCVQEEER
ncbi:unnamed protein product [Spirodela intermedia]|uniref:Uncharacterized protein n=1 Tax=Spirodela intermedia TaxID=51605 RepID=A0A7I8L4D5_SPIIN|nr:unnamed protein product [Spirodela intermedia]